MNKICIPRPHFDGIYVLYGLAFILFGCIALVGYMISYNNPNNPDAWWISLSLYGYVVFMTLLITGWINKLPFKWCDKKWEYYADFVKGIELVK